MEILTILVTTLALCFGGRAIAAGSPDDHKPMHGGIVVEGKAADFELVARTDVIQLYLRDHGKVMSAANASAKLTMFSGSEKHEVTLAPAGDKLEAKGNFKVAAGTKVVALITKDGKSIGTARFTLK